MAVDLRSEVDYIVNDIRFSVSDITASSKLPLEDNLVYLNITTKEEEKFCVELTPCGFRVVGRQYDMVEEDTYSDSKTFETVYALLQDISPSYVNTFGNELISKLSSLEYIENNES